MPERCFTKLHIIKANYITVVYFYSVNCQRHTWNQTKQFRKPEPASCGVSQSQWETEMHHFRERQILNWYAWVISVYQQIALTPEWNHFLCFRGPDGFRCAHGCFNLSVPARPFRGITICCQSQTAFEDFLWLKEWAHLLAIFPVPA